jgi:hypothetical protein
MLNLWLMTATALFGVVLSLRLLRLTSARSVLAWYALIFIALFNVAVHLLGSPMDLAYSAERVPYTQNIVDHVVTSLTLANVIVTLMLLVFQSRLSAVGRSLRGQGSGTATLNMPPLYLLGIVFSIFSFVLVLLSPGGQERLRYGLLSVFGQFSDAQAYYGVRVAVAEAGWSSLINTAFGIGTSVLLPILTAFSLQQALLGAGQVWKLRWLALLSFWVVVALFGLSKFPFLQIALTNMLTWLLCVGVRRGRWRILIPRIVLAALVTVFVLITLYHLTQGIDDIGELVSVFLGRIFLTPMRTTLAHFVVFPDQHDFMYWSGSRMMHTLLAPLSPMNREDLQTYQIASYYSMGSIYNMNTGFVGDGWAQFGYTGVAQSALVIFGVFLAADLYFLVRRKGAIPTAALVAFMIGSVGSVMGGAVLPALIGGGVLIGPLFYASLFKDARQAKPSRLRAPRALPSSVHDYQPGKK